MPPIACFAQKYVSQIMLGLAYIRCTHLLNFTRSTHMHTTVVFAPSKLKQISSISRKMSYQLVDLDSPCQFTCYNVQILHLYTNYIYFPILPDPLSCLVNHKHELAHTAISDLCWEHALEVIIEMMILRLYPWHILWVWWISIIDKLVLIDNYKLFYLYGFVWLF